MKKTLKGIVVSDKMDKTAVVAVDRLKEHSKYKKKMKISKHYKAHDEKNVCKVGDQVIIIESQPISKDKKWRILEVVRPASRVTEEEPPKNSEEEKEMIKKEKENL